MTEWDAPNQQVVRPDQSAPWEEGTGGVEVELAGREADEPTVSEMTKAQLITYADSRGIDVHDEMTKAEIRQTIEEAE